MRLRSRARVHYVARFALAEMQLHVAFGTYVVPGTLLSCVDPCLCAVAGRVLSGWSHVCRRVPGLPATVRSTGRACGGPTARVI